MDTLINELVAFGTRAMEGDKQSILLMCSVYCLLVLGYSVIYQCRMRRWSSTTGNLEYIGNTLSGFEQQRSDRTYRLHALYQYEVNGKAYVGRRVSSWIVIASHNLKGILHLQARGVEYIGEDLVRVYYNPYRPAKSILIPPGLTSIFVITLGAVSPLGLYLHYYS